LINSLRNIVGPDVELAFGKPKEKPSVDKTLNNEEWK